MRAQAQSIARVSSFLVAAIMVLCHDLDNGALYDTIRDRSIRAEGVAEVSASIGFPMELQKSMSGNILCCILFTLDQLINVMVFPVTERCQLLGVVMAPKEARPRSWRAAPGF